MIVPEGFKVRCDVLGKKHRWQERHGRKFGSSQKLGSYWLCLDCPARAEEKPPDAVDPKK